MRIHALFKKAGLKSFAILILLALVSCVSEPGKTDSSEFMKANADTIKAYTLDNGMALIVKKNSANQIFNLKVVFKGGVALTTPADAGIEALTLAMLNRGSQKYTYGDLQKIQYEKSSSIAYTMSGYDYSSFDLNTLDKYWNELYPVFSDLLMNPAFLAGQFAEVQNDMKVLAQKKLADQYEVAISKLHGSMFAGHPYAAEFAGTLESLASISLEDVKKYYAEKFDADRMFVVAVGNFDEKELIRNLNGTIGKIANKGVKIPEVARYVPRADLILETFPKAKGVSYVRGDYPIADVASPDFAVQQLANTMLGEILFSIVRTDHGACYSVWSNAHGFKNTYGSLVVYKTDQPNDSKIWVDEAIALLASGKTMNIKGDSGEKYADLSQTINAYKNKFTNTFFSGQQTNAQTAAQIASGYVYYDNPGEYLKFIDKIKNITPNDIVRVVDKYMVNGTLTWIVIGDEPSLAKIDKARFLKFTGTVK